MISIFGLLLLWPAWCLAAPSSSTDNECRCVPDQWEGRLSTFDREFDLHGGRSAASDSLLYVHYDYKNQLFAMRDLQTGSIALADYNLGFKYVIRGNSCNGIRTEEPMRKMCLPEGSKMKGHFHLGIDIPADLWEFQGPQNVTMKTLVLRETCVPVTEEVYLAKGGYASVTSTTYMDVSLGIKDKSVFDRPAGCDVEMMSHYEDIPTDNQEAQKRFDSHDSVLKALKERLHN